MFVDYTKIEIKSGDGGAGIISFRREKYVPKGGPDGGDGGRGGHIMFSVDNNLHTLQDIRYHKLYKAERGGQGGKNQRFGKNGKDIKISVPPGTVIKDANNDEVLADLTIVGDEYVACYGGKGGRGNTHFKTPTNQTPRQSQPGLPGEHKVVELELKVLADVGLVGLPNAGKSTLLSAISAAKPKIANYPFTTMQPHLGIVKYGDFTSFVMADIPGLIEGASQGKGLGHQFLRHIERNRLLLYMIDAGEENPQSVFDTLKNEVLLYNPSLKLKPYIIVRSKYDTIQHQEISATWKEFSEEYIDISSVTGYGIKILIQKIVPLLTQSY
ncbi:MAG: GTPase ObgE [Candidatus Marinimicrobia bacterium]|nr:GTPase ObgE [Candidatus Neomarinimicrobiota bacterium]